jgi:hypothetical protein
MNASEKRQLRADHDQAVVTEEDLRYAIADHERELSAADAAYEPRRVQMLEGQLADLRRRLAETQAKVDQLRAAMRAADVPAAEPPHPGGAVAAILERDKRPRQWNVGGDINDRDAAWEAPIVKQQDGPR